MSKRSFTCICSHFLLLRLLPKLHLWSEQRWH